MDADDLTIPAILIRPGGERSVQHLDCVANTAGEAIAVWRETERDGTPQVWTSHLPPGSNDWETPRQLGLRTAAEIDPTVKATLLVPPARRISQPGPANQVFRRPRSPGGPAGSPDQGAGMMTPRGRHHHRR